MAKHTQWQDVFGNVMEAAWIVDAAQDEGLSLDEWLADMLDELERCNPGGGYTEYDADDVARFARQIGEEATRE